MHRGRMETEYRERGEGRALGLGRAGGRAGGQLTRSLKDRSVNQLDAAVTRHVAGWSEINRFAGN